MVVSKNCRFNFHGSILWMWSSCPLSDHPWMAQQRLISPGFFAKDCLNLCPSITDFLLLDSCFCSGTLKLYVWSRVIIITAIQYTARSGHLPKRPRYRTIDTRVQQLNNKAPIRTHYSYRVCLQRPLPTYFSAILTEFCEYIFCVVLVKAEHII